MAKDDLPKPIWRPVLAEPGTAHYELFGGEPGAGLTRGDRMLDWSWRWLGFGRPIEYSQTIRNAEAAKRMSDALIASLPPPEVMWPEERPWIRLDPPPAEPD